MPQDIRETISQQLIAAISTGAVPWKRPWRASKNAGSPANAISGRSYSGVGFEAMGTQCWIENMLRFCSNYFRLRF